MASGTARRRDSSLRHINYTVSVRIDLQDRRDIGLATYSTQMIGRPSALHRHVASNGMVSLRGRKLLTQGREKTVIGRNARGSHIQKWYVHEHMIYLKQII